MKRYNLTPQEKNNFCVCSVLQAVFRRYSLEYTQEQIASELTPSKKGFYVDDSNFYEFMLRNGFKYDFFRYNETPFNEPDTLLREMNSHHGIIGINSHVFLLTEFIDPKLKLIDPLNGTIQNKDLINIMKETCGWFGLIKKINGGQLSLRI